MAFARKPYFFFIFSLFFSFFSFSANAWNALGHMVVASIAYQHLDPSVREKIDGLIQNYFQQEYPEITTFSQIAYWPDAIRGQKIETFTHWHYIDIAISIDGTPLKNLMDTDNAVWAIKNIETIVKNPHANPYERARFLAFLVHLVGDIHQPLHTASSISALHPDGDRGGNDYYILLNKNRRNLHKLWDEGFDTFGKGNSIDEANQLAATISATYPENYFGYRVSDLTPEDWVQEGVLNAKNYVYNTPEEQPAIEGYEVKGKEIAEQQVAVAGFRLAALLNQLMS